MFDKLENMVRRYDQLSTELSQESVLKNPKLLKELAKEQSELEALVQTYRRWKKIDGDLKAVEELSQASDAEMAQMAATEAADLTAQKIAIENELKQYLLPKDPNDGKNILVEIRAGTGGDEAALFAAVLFRAYSRFAERHRLRCEIISGNETGLGGYKEVILSIQGKTAYQLFHHESGVHRVQRVPRTEAQGRVHTSTATVAVMPEVDEVEVQIKDEELRIDVYRSGGPGGQSVNTTDSAVRITHLPTGLVVTCQDEKSQLKNKAKALKILRARILDMEQSKQHASQSEMRKSQIGSGDRSERIRTYNFPQMRVTDHRINFTTHQLDAILDGALDELVQALNQAQVEAELSA